MALAVVAEKFGNGVLKSVTRDLKSGGKMVINTFHVRPGIKPEAPHARLGRFLTLPEDSFLAKAGIKQIGKVKDGASGIRNGVPYTEDSVYAMNKDNKCVAIGIDAVKNLISAIRHFGLKL